MLQWMRGTTIAMSILIDGLTYAERFPKYEEPDHAHPLGNWMSMSHEASDLHTNGIFNLMRGVHNQGNEWWIFTGEGKPIETWRTEQRAKYYLGKQNEHAASWGLAPRMLYRCIPGIGFVRQES